MTTPTLEQMCRDLEGWLGDDLTVRNDAERAVVIFQKFRPVSISVGRFSYGITIKGQYGDLESHFVDVPELRIHNGTNAANRLWSMRRGQPWQAALEAHVVAYRRPPRRFDESADLCRRVLFPALLKKPGMMEAFMCELVGDLGLGANLEHDSFCLAEVCTVLCTTSEQIVMAAWRVTKGSE